MTRAAPPKSPYRAAIVVQVCSTLFMTGVIWTIQLLHYPSFKFIDLSEFVAFVHFHKRLITVVVAVPMLAELFTAVLLTFRRPPRARRWIVWSGLALIVIIWISTAFVQVPLHQALAAGFDPGVHEALVRTNWIRTVAWTARALLVCSLVATGTRRLWRRRDRRTTVADRTLE